MRSRIKFESQILSTYHTLFSTYELEHIICSPITICYLFFYYFLYIYLLYFQAFL